MTTPRSPSAPGPASAASAFLRGVERRAALFAQWQCGDIETGDAALANAMADFVGIAPQTAFPDWPRRFWSLLLAAPLLRAPAPLVPGDDGLDVLAGLSGGPRVTLLLRLVAGLSEHDAATVLGVSRATYRLGLRRALPHQADGTPDPDAWRALAQRVQQAVRALPADRLARLAAIREAAMQGTVAALRRFPVARPHAATPGTSTTDIAPAIDAPAPRPRWLWPALAAVALATGAALAATWWQPWRSVGDDDAAQIRVEPLGAAAEPQARYDDDTALLTERDFDLLLDAASAEGAADTGSAWRDDPAFHAWLAVHLDVPVTADPPPGEAPPPADDDAGMETSDAGI